MEKKIKAWMVCDGKQMPLVFGAMKDKPEKTIFFVYQNEKAAKDAWDGFEIKPCTITYKRRPNNNT